MIKVDNVNWTPEEVAKHSREEFLAMFMADPHMYKKHDEARKLAALNAVYDQCVPQEPEPTKPKGKKAKAEPLDEE